MIRILKQTGRIAAAAALAGMAFITLATSSWAADTIYLVRHAEKVLDGTRDPALTAQGAERAEYIARLLAPLEVGTVYSTDYIRTRDTAQPLADALDVPISLYNPRAPEEFVDSLKATPGNILVVGHSNTTPGLVNLLAGTAYEDLVEATEYGALFIVQFDEEGELVGARKTDMGFTMPMPPDEHE